MTQHTLGQGDLFLNQVVPKSPNKVQEEDEAEAEDRRLSKVGTGEGMDFHFFDGC